MVKTNRLVFNLNGFLYHTFYYYNNILHAKFLDRLDILKARYLNYIILWFILLLNLILTNLSNFKSIFNSKNS